MHKGQALSLPLFCVFFGQMRIAPAGKPGNFHMRKCIAGGRSVWLASRISRVNSRIDSTPHVKTRKQIYFPRPSRADFAAR